MTLGSDGTGDIVEPPSNPFQGLKHMKVYTLIEQEVSNPPLIPFRD